MFAVGDIHGRADMFADIIEQLAGQPFITMGDMVDRGCENISAMKMAVDHAEHCILGDHDYMMA